MALEKDEVGKIAHLARLNISDEQSDQYSSELSRILELVETMESVATETTEPMAHPFDATQRLREDKVTESDQRDHFQKIAPAVENGLYLVPRVIE